MDIPDESDLIAPYLVSIISDYPYRRYIQYISSEESVTEDMFMRMELSKTYWVDRRNCHKLDGSRNASAIFDLFGVFSNELGTKVRENMIKQVEIEDKIYNSVGQVVLGMRLVDLETWCNEMKDCNQFPDELALYALSRSNNRHTVVLCRQRFWTTLETSSPLMQEELFQACQIHLVYLGCGLFGELKLKPFSGEILNPITLDSLTSALATVKGKGRPRTQPLNLKVEHSLPTNTSESGDLDQAHIAAGISGISHDNDYHKNSTIATLSDQDTSPSDDVLPPATTQMNINPSSNHREQNTSQKETGTDSEPLVQIPDQFWLHPMTQEQQHEDSEINTAGTKGRNEPNETDDNMKGSYMENVALTPNPIDKIEELFITSVKQHKCYILLERLKPEVIKKFCPRERSPSIDPYSSLEDIGNDSDDVSVPQKNWNKICEDRRVEEPDNYPPVTHSHTSYYMCERNSRKRTSTRPQRKCSAVNYALLLGQDSGNDEPEKKKPVRKLKVTSEPSKDRIAAQQMIDASEKPKHRPPKPDLSSGRRFFRKDPSKTKPVHRKTVPIKSEQEEPTNTPDAKPGTSNDMDPVTSPPKGQFKTKEHGLKKHKDVRYFKCPRCGIHKTTVMKLNDHYKRRHPLLKCDKCTMSFSTPSGLSRHMYVHSTPRYPCLDCPKTFHFSSELKTHRVVHLKIKAHFCNRGNCGKSFMNNPDLLKHVREHDAKPVSCSECDYTTKNQRLLKSHALSHTNEKPYSCFFCAEKFKYRTQLHRHREKCPQKPARSDSPEH